MSSAYSTKLTAEEKKPIRLRPTRRRKKKRKKDFLRGCLAQRINNIQPPIFQSPEYASIITGNQRSVLHFPLYYSSLPHWAVGKPFRFQGFRSCPIPCL